jgi:hypothetical protein
MVEKACNVHDLIHSPATTTGFFYLLCFAAKPNQTMLAVPCSSMVVMADPHPARAFTASRDVE